MLTPIQELNALSKKCACGNKHYDILIEKIVISYEALKDAAAYVAQKGFKRIVLIADENTFQAAGYTLSVLLKSKDLNYSACLIKPDDNGDVTANEVSLVQAMIETPKETDVFLAIGSGTIHDITRFCSDKMNIPFISIPTAPSVDGFNSMGAPLIIRGVKKTFQAVAPIAIFADLSVLKEAPRKMIAAGFGDMLGKATSLSDWRFGHLVAEEPFCPFVASLTKDALESCIEHVDTIAEGNEAGVLVLMEALIQSGLAMLIMGHSHSASGGEHHISHYWEMNFIQNGKPQVLHGAKVGVSTPFIAQLYRKEFASILNDSKQLKTIQNRHDTIARKLIQYKDELQTLVHSMIDPENLRTMMDKVGGASTPSQLGIDSNLLEESIALAHHVRDRFTVLKFLNEIAEKEQTLEIFGK